MISYAQNGEDVLLDRLFPADYRGYYIDIGANHPVFHSVTKHFSDRGWRGINIEPLPGVFEELARQRTNDINLNVAVSSSAGTLRIHEPKESCGEATLSEEKAEILRGRGMTLTAMDVEVTTLAAVCERYLEPGQVIDFLKIDVEEHEREVLLGADWSRWRPRVLVIEGNPERWEDLVLAQGYVAAGRDGVNRYYLRSEDAGLAERLADPANALDDFVSYEVVRRDEQNAQMHEELVRVHKEFQSLLGACLAAQKGLGETVAQLEKTQGELAEARREVSVLAAQLTVAQEVVQATAKDLDVAYRRVEQEESKTAALREMLTLDDGEMIGPASLAMVQRMRNLSRRFPAAARAVKRLRVAAS